MCLTGSPPEQRIGLSSLGNPNVISAVTKITLLCPASANSLRLLESPANPEALDWTSSLSTHVLGLLSLLTLAILKMILV